MSPSTVTLTDRKTASAEASRGSCHVQGNNKAEATFLCVLSTEVVFRTKRTHFGVLIHGQLSSLYINQMTGLYPLIVIVFSAHFQRRCFHFKKELLLLPFIKP